MMPTHSDWYDPQLETRARPEQPEKHGVPTVHIPYNAFLNQKGPSDGFVVPQGVR